MTDEDLIKLLFDPLRNRPSGGVVPPPRTLSKSLTKLVPKTGSGPITLTRDDATLFATASIEIWHRAVHSLLVSIALKEASPIWSAVAGYYASHYVFRAAAHILGLLSLHGAKCTVEINGPGAPYLGAVVKGRKREHDWYREKVSKSMVFGGDAFFQAKPSGGLDDQNHRNIASYGDHLSRFPQIQPFDTNEIKERMRMLEQHPAAVPPEIGEDRFPDLEAVWILAYQRIGRFRGFLDGKVGPNRFWQGHRNPSWASQFTNFDLADASGMSTSTV